MIDEVLIMQKLIRAVINIIALHGKNDAYDRVRCLDHESLGPAKCQ